MLVNAIESGDPLDVIPLSLNVGKGESGLSQHHLQALKGLFGLLLDREGGRIAPETSRKKESPHGVAQQHIRGVGRLAIRKLVAVGRVITI